MSSQEAKDTPDEQVIAAAAELEIFDAAGVKINFGSVFKDQKTIVVFIRHFFCGVSYTVKCVHQTLYPRPPSCPDHLLCQLFAEQLAAVPKEALDQAHVRIVLIGCGEYSPIKTYAENTKFTGDIYSNPTRDLYHALGMDVENLKGTPAGEQRRSYLQSSPLVNAIQSIWRGPLKQPQYIGKQGKISQLGGDFIFGPGNTCSFASRMRHTEDHVDVADLMREADVAMP